MIQKGKVSIDSDTLNSVVSGLNSAANALESDIAGKLPGAFEALSTAGLYSNGLSKIKEQAQYVATLQKNIASDVSSHLEGTVDTEEDLSNTFDTHGNYDAGGGGGGGNNHNSGDNSDNDVDNGKKIKSDQLIANINAIDYDNVEKLVNFLNVNKEKDSLVSLIFNFEKSQKLGNKILKAFGYEEFSSITESEYKEIQKTLIDKLFAQENVPEKLQMNSLLTAKEYLVLVAKKNNINVSDLLVEDKHENVLQQALKDLYAGNVTGYDVSQQTVSGFKNYIDGIASDNNIAADKVFDNLKLLY